MKSLIDMIFKREPSLDYVIAKYKPSSDFVARPRVAVPEYEVDLLKVSDEMEIDNLYQRS